MAGVNHVPFNRGNLEIKYKWPCCEPAVVEVWSLPKRQGTTHKWGPSAKPPKLDKPYVDPKAPKKSGKEMSAEAAQSAAPPTSVCGAGSPSLYSPTLIHLLTLPPTPSAIHHSLTPIAQL